MEEVHGVDVSWMHKPNKGTQSRKYRVDVPDRSKALRDDAEPRKQHQRAVSTPTGPTDRKSPSTTTNSVPPQQNGHNSSPHNRYHEANRYPAPPQPAPPKVSNESNPSTTASQPPNGDSTKRPNSNMPSKAATPSPAQSQPATPSPQQQPTPSKRPGLLSRSNSERKGDGRKSSWMSNISSKFSTSSQNAATSPLPSPPIAQVSAKQQQLLSASAPSTSSPLVNAVPASATIKKEEAESYTPAKPKESSTGFFSSLTRKMSSASQNTGSSPKVRGTGGVCPRKVLNVDPNRKRCLVPELDQNKLRRVSFCVDVEIASGPKYYNEDVTAGTGAEPEDDLERKKKKRDMKLKDKAEGAAMKNPELLQQIKDEQNQDSGSSPQPLAKTDSNGTPPKPTIRVVDDGDQNAEDGDKGRGSEDSNAPGDPDDESRSAKKKEKKAKSEAERKQRRENRRRRAEEQGLTPVEFRCDSDEETATGTAADPPQHSLASGFGGVIGRVGQDEPATTIPASRPTSVAKQDRPTTDPVRIYRRCCQLRETPILKRITEQLMSPKSCVPGQPGVVACLDLTGSRLQLADVVTLSDWLAVVPVKRLLMEDADLSDEGVRVVLAGLLAAKKPEPTKRKANKPLHRQADIYTAQGGKREERSGVVEKVSFKNNPRLTRLAWKGICLFLYMCKSIKAMDLSMNRFPDTLPPSASLKPTVPGANSSTASVNQDKDTAEVLYKSLSERYGGSTLEELSVSECSLNTDQVRKIIDGAVMCGVSRLGLAGNNLDDEALTHVIHYIRSGVCHGLDLGGNDLRGGKLNMIAEALSTSDKVQTLPFWGLSLAQCNLDAASIKNLFPALVKLPDFRFLDVSHNRDLCADGKETQFVGMLRRYIPLLKELKRIHIGDVGLSPRQAIAIAEVLPEGPKLAHINMLENPQLTKLVNATDDASQEEACALYASLTAAARVSQTLCCVDIDVPGAETSEIVKALAKQLVAWCLRNMERFALGEMTGAATAHLTNPHGGEETFKDPPMQDLLLHIVGNVEGNPDEQTMEEEGAPDDDYIVGGTGVVKALQYVLGEKSNDAQINSPINGTNTPTRRPGSSAGLDSAETKGKVKLMSKSLLETARRIRSRLQPALVKESTGGDEMALRRLQFLDHTLQGIIARFEEEYPECCIVKQPPPRKDSLRNRDRPEDLHTLERLERQPSPAIATDRSYSSDEDDAAIKAPAIQRHASDVSIVSRKMGNEEGRLHRLGQHLRRDIVEAPSPLSPNSSSPGPDIFNRPPESETRPEELQRLREIGAKIESMSGQEVRGALEKDQGWEAMMAKVGASYEDLRYLQEQDPEGWQGFVQSHMAARANVTNPRPGSAMGEQPAKKTEGKAKRQGMVFN